MQSRNMEADLRMPKLYETAKKITESASNYDNRNRLSDTGPFRGPPALETIFGQRVLNVIISLGTLIISTVFEKRS